MLERILVPANAGWVDTGVTIPPATQLHIIAARAIVTGGALGTDTPVATGFDPDPGGLDVDGNKVSFPEGSYGNNSLLAEENPSGVVLADPRGEARGQKLASGIPPFALVAAFSSNNPGFGVPNALRVNRRSAFSPSQVGSGGKLWLGCNDYESCFGNNTGFYEVVVAYPEPGETVWSGSFPWSQQNWVSTGIAVSGRNVRIAACGLGRMLGSMSMWHYLHPEGYYTGLSPAHNSNPQYSPTAASSAYHGSLGTPRDPSKKPYCLLAAASVSDPPFSLVSVSPGRDSAYTQYALGSGTLHVATNRLDSYAGNLYGTISVIVVASTETPPPMPAASGHMRIVGSYDTKVFADTTNTFGAKGL